MTWKCQTRGVFFWKNEITFNENDVSKRELFYSDEQEKVQEISDVKMSRVFGKMELYLTRVMRVNVNYFTVTNKRNYI